MCELCNFAHCLVLSLGLCSPNDYFGVSRALFTGYSILIAWCFFYRLSGMSRVASLDCIMVAAVEHRSEHAEVHSRTAGFCEPRPIINHPQAAKQVDHSDWREHGDSHLQAMTPAMPTQDHP